MICKLFRYVAGMAALCLTALPASAEEAVYGEVVLTGLARQSWMLPGSAVQDVMVCNLDGPDGFLTIRAGPGKDYPKVRAFHRLATLTVDVGALRGRWVRVVDGGRSVTKEGAGQQYTHLPVQGWAHDGYLCSFLH